MYLRGLVARHGTVDQVIASMDAKKVQPRRLPSFAEFSDRWIRNFVEGKNKPGECRNKRSSLAIHLVPAFGHLPLAGITTEAVEQLKSSLLQRPLSAKTINNHLVILRKCLDTAVECGELASVPKIRQLKAATPSFRFLDRAEVGRLLDHAVDDDWRHLILAAARTGMRYGELSALRWEDVDFAHGLIHVRRSRYLRQETAPKNNRTRVLPIAADLAEVLRERSARVSSYVFERQGRPIPWETASKALARVCERAGMKPLGWHVLRHTFASELALCGVAIQAIRELLGHATIQMTLRYAHLTQDTLRDAIARLAVAEPQRAFRPTGGQPVPSGAPTAEALAA